MLRVERYTCIKCGKQFTKVVGGIIASPLEHELSIRPACDSCKLKTITKMIHKER